jgi:hypothetical protein
MEDRYTLVTGASRGIGKAISEQCALRGMNLVLVSLPDQDLEKVAWDIARKFSVKTHFLELDLTLPDAPQDLFDWCMDRELSIDVLINNAGVGYQGNFEDYDSAFYDDLLKINVTAPTLLTRIFLPELKKQTKSRILNISSMGSFYPMPYKAAYAASKSYITRFSEALHEELKDTSVSVSVLCPAGVDSVNEAASRIKEIGWIASSGKLTPEQVAAVAVKGMLNNKRRIIPGRVNMLFYYMTRMLSEAIKAWLIHAVLHKFHNGKKKLAPAKVVRKERQIT